MSFDNEFLKYVIRNRGFTIDGFIAHLSITKQTFYKKAKNPSKFTYNEIMEINNTLHLTNEEIISIFFKK